MIKNGVILLFLYFYCNNAIAQCTSLPIIKINTLGQNIQDNIRIICDMGIINNSSGNNCLNNLPNDYNGKIAIEYRGSSSQMFPKKPYGFSTVNALGANFNTSLLGMPSDNDWVLLNPYTDKTFMRDVLAYDMAREMGWYASRTKFVELYINSNPQGIYVLLEKIKQDKNRIDISKIDSSMNAGDSLTGGYIFKIDKITGNSGNWWNSTSQNITYQNHDPNWDDITPQQSNYLKNYINAFESALFSNNFTDPNLGYRKLANIYSFIDLIIINEITNNVDGYRLSTFIYKDRDSKCGRFTIGPVWDYNLSFGNADYCNGGTAGWQFIDGCANNVGSGKYVSRLLQDPYFKNMLRCRWNELRATILSNNYILTKIDNYTNILQGPKNLDSTLWQTIGNYIWPNAWVSGTWQGEIDSMKNWYINRAAWLDANMYATTLLCGSTNTMEVTIDEINYKSDSTKDAGDWLELYNYGSTAANLSNAIIINGDSYKTYCVLPNNTLIQAGQRLVVYADSTKFVSQFPNVTNKIGPLCFNLNSSAQKLELRDKDNKMIKSITYGNSMPWPIVCNGNGRTLQLKTTSANPNLPTSWMSGCLGGSPGQPYTNCTDESIIVSEINFNAPNLNGAGDWFEIYNKSNNTIDLTNWKVQNVRSSTIYTLGTTLLNAGNYLILYTDPIKFNSKYPSIVNKRGPTNSLLSDTNDVIKLYNALGKLSYSIQYSSQNPWPTQCNGTGRTLESTQYNANLNEASSWIDGCIDGSPSQLYDPACVPLTVKDWTDNNTFQLYPNPCEKMLNINTSLPIRSITIKNISGVVVKTCNYLKQIEINDFPKGIYFISLIDEDGHSYTQKIIKL